ncbi:hypothetical protein A9B99_06165 [Mangrovibacter phragmitis]|uniref:Transposase n=1 Tax=Mangrovibacter phragmitis TaxID=1691903 RepID=A0A1B7L3P5_9ENTR|nr:hypothetical protein [Mangrovibacter phragmitis]OAT76898.1 hypothetical protein A9B99_06165 [Mangrovibacter phragmitis]
MATIAQQLEQLGREDGWKQGVREGERQVALKIARGLLQRGAEYQFITEVTGVTQDDLAQIARTGD